MGTSRSRRFCYRLLKQIIKDSREAEYRNRLKGTDHVKSSVVYQCESFLTQLRMAPKRTRPIPSTLFSTIAAQRKLAADKKLSAMHRFNAVRRLLLIEGLQLVKPNRNGQENDSVEEFICQKLGMQPYKRPESKTCKEERAEQRRRALVNIRTTLREDVAAGLIRTLDEAIEHLRLPEMPAPARESVLPKEAVAAIAALKEKYARGGDEHHGDTGDINK